MTKLQKAQLIALAVFIAFPFVVWTLKHWWVEITSPIQASDDEERLTAKASVIVIFGICLIYSTLGLLASLFAGQLGLAAFCTTLTWWLWVGLVESDRLFHLREVLRWRF